MKKPIKYLLLIFTLILTISAVGCAGCNFINNNNAGGGEGGGGSNPQDPSTYQKVAVDVDLKSSLTFAEGVTYTGKSHSGDPYSSVADTITATKVNRASVSIFIELDDSMVCGSGVIVDINDGVNYGLKEDNIFYVITCQHVIDVCEKDGLDVVVSVPDASGKNYDDAGYDINYNFKGKVGGAVDANQAVSLVGGDRATDIAVLRLYVENDAIATNIVKAKIMSTEYSPRLGEEVFAIGNSEGSHGGWTSAGVISDISCVEEIDGVGDMSLMGINVDIYQGNSGGGLFNLYGELIAITNAGETISSADGKVTSIGINFAIPHKVSSDPAKDTGFVNVVKQLIGSYLSSGKNYGYVYGRVDNYWFTYGVSDGYVVVSSIIDGSQAVGKVNVGDVIKSVKVNDGEEENVSSREALKAVINSLDIGDSITVNFIKTSEYGQSTSYSRTFTAMQYLFCNTGDYTNIKVA